MEGKSKKKKNGGPVEERKGNRILREWLVVFYLQGFGYKTPIHTFSADSLFFTLFNSSFLLIAF